MNDQPREIRRAHDLALMFAASRNRATNRVWEEALLAVMDKLDRIEAKLDREADSAP